MLLLLELGHYGKINKIFGNVALFGQYFLQLDLELVWLGSVIFKTNIFLMALFSYSY